MKKIYQIDEYGFMTYEMLEVEPIGIDEEDNPIYEIPYGFIDVPLPYNKEGQLPFYRPRWTGIEWVEDKTQAEFDEEAAMESLNPSKEELANADLEIKMITLLMEMEVI